MNAEAVAPVILLAAGVVFTAVWFYKYVWKNPKVVRGVVVEKTCEAAATRLPDVLPGTGGVFQASTTNILVLEVDGKEERFTANDESWRRAAVGDRVKVWLQGDSHVVGVYVLERHP